MIVWAAVISFAAFASEKYLSQMLQCQYSMLPSDLVVAALAATWVRLWLMDSL